MGAGSGSEALNERGAANGSVVMAKRTAPNNIRARGVAVFIAETLSEKLRAGLVFAIINRDNRFVLPKAKKPRVEMFGRPLQSARPRI
jgi:hypothetical protein